METATVDPKRAGAAPFVTKGLRFTLEQYAALERLMVALDLNYTDTAKKAIATLATAHGIHFPSDAPVPSQKAS